MAEERKQPTRRKAPTRRASAKKASGGSPADAAHAPETADENDTVRHAQRDDDAVAAVSKAEPGNRQPETTEVPKEDGADSQSPSDASAPKEHKQPTRRKAPAPAATPARKKAAGKALAKRSSGSGNAQGSGKSSHRVWLFVVVLVVFIAFTVCSLLFCWQKWWRFDDYADIKGAWKVEATGDVIVFDAHELKLTNTISYDYRLNTQDKLITYTFGELEGGGHYYFDTDRQRLVIFDGDETLGFFAELGFFGSELDGDTADDAMTVLSKVSDDVDAQPTGTSGTAAGGISGERAYLVEPDPEPSSSSSSKRDAGSSSSAADETEASDDDADAEDTLSEDGDETTADESYDEGYDETYDDGYDQEYDEGDDASGEDYAEYGEYADDEAALDDGSAYDEAPDA